MIQAKIGVIIRETTNGKQYGSEVAFETIPTKEEATQAVIALVELAYAAYEKDIAQTPLLTPEELLKLISSKWYKSLHELSTEAKVAYKWVMMAITGEKIPEMHTRRLTRFLNSL